MAAMERFGKYELVELLGRGGMAEVWKAKIRGMAGFERTLVVKRILPQLASDEEFVAMFMREAQLCSMLSHANIVQVFELGSLDGEYYLAMEYVNGRDVHAVVRARPKTPPPAGLAALVVRDVCLALDYAYAVPDEHGKPLRVIHRDVTPSNVMLTVDGTVKLVDFGVAKALNMASSALTNTGGLRGKVGYAAPEQIRGKPVDHRTDLFAVGIIAHELLTGRRLFQGETDQESIDLVLNAPIYAPSRINAQVPQALDALVLRALERDPALRFQSGEEMAEAFAPLVHQLGFGPAQVGALLRERFPELDERARWIDEAASLASGSTSPGAPPVELDEHAVLARPSRRSTAIRPTASYVQSAADMGAWTSDTHETIRIEPVRGAERVSEPRVARNLPVAEPPPQPQPRTITGHTRSPLARRPALRVGSALAFGGGGALIGALGLLGYLNLPHHAAAPAPTMPGPTMAAPAPPPPPPPVVAAPEPAPADEAPAGAKAAAPAPDDLTLLAPMSPSHHHGHDKADKKHHSHELTDPFERPQPAEPTSAPQPQPSPSRPAPKPKDSDVLDPFAR